MWNSSQTISALANYVTPEVGSETVLWLSPGPGSAFGGNIYRLGIHGISANNVAVRAEKRFGESVRANPPNYIIASNLSEWDDKKWSLMRSEVLDSFISENYNLILVLENNGYPIKVWRRTR